MWYNVSMTIKRTWTDRKGRVREKTLQSGYKERIEMVIDDAEGKGYLTFRKGIVHVVSNDEIRFEEKDTFLSKLFGFNITTDEGQTLAFEKGDIIELQTGHYSLRNKIIGRRKKEISFVWEPTLPLTSRK